MKYWNNTGKYESEAAKLSLLVPAMGRADTFKGELWRAATRIYYDHFNNGFGNFWKEPAAFLITNLDLPECVRQVMFEHANGNINIIAGDYDEEMDLMIDTVIEQMRDIQDRPNTQDMWEFEADWELDRKFWPEDSSEKNDWDYEEDDYYC